MSVACFGQNITRIKQHTILYTLSKHPSLERSVWVPVSLNDGHCSPPFPLPLTSQVTIDFEYYVFSLCSSNSKYLGEGGIILVSSLCDIEKGAKN